MLELEIKTKQQLIAAMQKVTIKHIIGKDIYDPSDLNDIKKSALQHLRSSNVTVFVLTY